MMALWDLAQILSVFQMKISGVFNTVGLGAWNRVWSQLSRESRHQGTPRGHKRIFWTRDSIDETFLRSYVYIHVSTGHQKTIFLVTGDTAWGRFLNHLLASQRSQMALASTFLGFWGWSPKKESLSVHDLYVFVIQFDIWWLCTFSCDHNSLCFW